MWVKLWGNSLEFKNEIYSKGLCFNIKSYLCVEYINDLHFMKNSLFRISVWFFVTLLSCAFISCEKDDTGGAGPISKGQLSGKVEKGPFVQGSEVVIYELNSNLAQTGKSFRSQTDNYLGEFNLNTAMDLVSPYIELSVSGYYYNEVKGDFSGPITLRAVADISNRNSVNVNLLTQLERGRVLKLLQQGLSFGEAKKQADHELMAVFAITDKFSNPEDISIADNNDNAGILLAVSTIMLYNRGDAEFSELVSMFSNEFAENGQIVSTAVRQAIQEGQKNAKPSEVIEKMKKFYSERGTTLLIQDFSKFIDFNGDGVIDEKDDAFKEDPTVVVVEDDYWPNKEAILTALAGCYYYFREFETNQLELEGIRIDRNQTHSIDSHNSNVSKTYNAAYRTINLANTFITHASSFVRNHPEEEQEVVALIAEARAIRAFTYYNLAMLWGNVPLVTESITTEDIQYPVQAEQTEVYEFAYREVCKALQQIPAQPNTTKDFRFTYKSILMLKAELELTLGKNNEANTTLDLLDSDPNFVLSGDNNAEVPIYTPVHRSVFKKEASGNSAEAALYWPIIANFYGYWAALKRLGKAQDETGCYDYELLMPFPSSEVAMNPNMTQNPGY